MNDSKVYNLTFDRLMSRLSQRGASGTTALFGVRQLAAAFGAGGNIPSNFRQSWSNDSRRRTPGRKELPAGASLEEALVRFCEPPDPKASLVN